MINNPYIIGLIAGILSGILASFAISGASIFKFLVYLAPLPCFIAAFGWRLNASLTAAVTGTFLLFALAGPQSGFGFLLSIGVPSMILGYLAYLSREQTISSGDGSAPEISRSTPDVNPQSASASEWYPPGHLLFWAGIMAGILSIFVIFSLGSDFETYRTAVKSLFENTFVAQLETLSGKKLSATEISTLSEVAVSILPGTMVFTWLTLTIFNLWLGARLTLAMGRLERPWPLIPGLEYPYFMAMAFVASIVLSMMGGMIQLIGIAFVTAFLILFIILGFAVLHAVTLGNPYRSFMLPFAYIVFLFVGQYGVLIMATLGIAEPIFKIRQKYMPPPPSPPRSPPRSPGA